ncbi:MAG: cation diffusion facilitator family transporter [Cytophagales bacterium]|nr:cation diffusion facilitator family transporter [Cytophagales bacterium]
MSDHCQSNHCHSASQTSDASPRYRRILWIALLLNAAMFFVEFLGSQHSGSNALFADSIDFFGDAVNYGVSLFVLGGTLLWRARTAWLKGLCMALFGAFVIGRSAWLAYAGTTPEPFMMGWIGVLALAVNVCVALMLYAYREGDANMRSVWLCTRNDAIGNVAVIGAAFATLLFVSRWPDVLVSLGMGCLALQSAWLVIRQAQAELKQAHLKTALKITD